MVGMIDVSVRRFGYNKLDWIDKDLATERNELGFIWENDFEYELIDFSISTDWQIKSYIEMLKDGY